MTIQKVIDIFKKYNFKDSEINVALKFLKSISSKNIYEGTLPKNKIVTYNNYGFFIVYVIINLKYKYLQILIATTETAETIELPLVEDYIENFEDTIDYDIKDIKKIIECYSNLNENRLY